MTAPPAPTNVTAAVNANDKITVSWDYDPTWFAFTGDDNTLGGFDEGVWYSEESVTNFEVQLTRDEIGWTDPSAGTINPTYDDSVDSYSESYYPNSDTAYESQIGIDSMFKFRVRAVNDSDQSSWITSGKVYTDPIPPHNPSVSRPDSNTIEITWNEKSDNIHYVRIEAREDTGDGYGSWYWVDNEFEGDTTFTWSTDGSSQSGNLPQEDARYQIRLATRSRGPNDRQSEYVYADYGNNGNVYFEDDFEDNDLAEWDVVNGSGGSVRSGSGPADLTISGADSGTYYYYGEGENDSEATYLQKDLGDLSNETDVHVRCAFATASLDDSAEDFGISWYDGSSWQALEHFHREYNQQGWYEVHVTVPDSALDTNNKVRVGTTTAGGMYSGDHWAVDRVVVSDILHEYTRPAQPTNFTLDTSVRGEITASWNDNAAFNDGVNIALNPTNENKYQNNVYRVTSPYTYTGLEDGKEYESQIEVMFDQYRNGVLDATYYNSDVTETAITLLPAPEASASAYGDKEIDVDWVDDVNFDSYDLYYRKVGNSTWIATDAPLGSDDSSEIVIDLESNTEYEFRVDGITEDATAQSNIASAFTFLNTTRSTSSHANGGSSSASRLVNLKFSPVSDSGRAVSSATGQIDVSYTTGSHSTMINSSSLRNVDLSTDVNSYASAVDSSVSRVTDVDVSTSSQATAVSSSAIRVVDLISATLSNTTQSTSSSKRSSLILETRTPDSHTTEVTSSSTGLINLGQSVSSSASSVHSESGRSGVKYAGRDVESSTDTATSSAIRIIDVVAPVSSYSKESRSFAYNERTSLELIDHNEHWNGSFWYTDWFQENKLHEGQDRLGIRSLVVPDSKEPCAIAYLEYDENGNGKVDERSEPISLGRDEEVHKVEGVPIDETGYYRIVITEYSGYNSLYGLDTAIIH